MKKQFSPTPEQLKNFNQVVVAQPTINPAITDYARALLAVGSETEAIEVLTRIPQDLIAEVDAMASTMRLQAEKDLEAEKTRLEGLKALASKYAPQTATATKSDLAAHIKTLWGDNPTQSEFLSSVLFHMGYDLDKAKAVHNAVLAGKVADYIISAYGPEVDEQNRLTGVPASVRADSTVWGHGYNTVKTTDPKNPKGTVRQRIANHVSKPPKFYVDGRC